MKEVNENNVTIVGINSTDEVCIQLTMGTTKVSGFIPLHGIKNGIEYITDHNMNDNELITISTDTDGLYISFNYSTGKMFWCRNPRLTNCDPVHITTTWKKIKLELQRFGLI